uniref:Uncharacterized protein n=1 Tax=Anguilla anguilla TaxID=7936 RepID=A0A0E9SNP8_ANGAN
MIFFSVIFHPLRSNTVIIIRLIFIFPNVHLFTFHIFKISTQ